MVNGSLISFGWSRIRAAGRYRGRRWFPTRNVHRAGQGACPSSCSTSSRELAYRRVETSRQPLRLFLARNHWTRLDGRPEPRAFDFDAGPGSIDTETKPLQQRFADRLAARVPGAPAMQRAISSTIDGAHNSSSTIA